jgi:hypothetical protein
MPYKKYLQTFTCRCRSVDNSLQELDETIGPIHIFSVRLVQTVGFGHDEGVGYLGKEKADEIHPFVLCMRAMDLRENELICKMREKVCRMSQRLMDDALQDVCHGLGSFCAAPWRNVPEDTLSA